MNIPDKFDLYFENKLSNSEKMKFERDLLEQPELAESYGAYFQINRIMENELYSPVLSYDNDPILKELSDSQRLAIEEDFIRFNTKESAYLSDNSLISDEENHSDRNDSKPLQTDNRIVDINKDELKFLQLLNKAAEIKSPGKFKIIRPYFSIAAAVVLSLFAGKLIFGPKLTGNNKISPQQAYTLYYNPRIDKELKSLSFDDQRLRSVFLDLKRTNLSSAAIFSNQMQVSDEDYELSLLFLGLINMERNDFSEARKCFTRILSFENPIKNNTVSYYLSLTYLSESNFAEAKSLLVKLSESKNPYSKKAKAILRSVKLQ